MKKIVIVTPYFYPKIGGVENYVRNIARRLHESGEYRVSIITSNQETKGYREETLDGITIHRLPVWFKISNTPINPGWYWWIKEFFATERPDIVWVHSPVPFMADIAILAAKKTFVVLTYHSGSMIKNRWLTDIPVYLYEHILLRALFRRANAIVSYYPKFAERQLIKFSYKTYFIPPGVDSTQFKATPLPRDTQIVTFVGRLEHNSSWKGIQQLLEAMALVVKKYPNTRLELVGDGDAVEYYRQIAEELNIGKSVTLVGSKTGKELADAYQRASVVVLPSTSDSESFGIVLIEAMASGRPVIGSNIGGIPSVIDNKKNGLLVAPNDPPALAKAIERILNNPQIAQELANNGVSKSQEFSWDTQTEKYRGLFSSLRKKVPIIHVTGYYPPKIGGMEIVARESALRLARKNYPVTVFTSDIDSGDAANNDIVPNYRLRRLKSVEVAHTPIIWSLPFHLIRMPKNSIFHVHIAHAGIAESAWLVAKVRNIPLIAHFHCDIAPSGSFGEKILPFYKKIFLGNVLRGADKVIVFSEEQSLLLQEKYDVKEGNIVIIPNGVAEDFFNRAERKLPDNSLQLLSVGRLHPGKRVDRLIKAVSLLKIPAQLTIVGDGEDRQKLENLAKKLDLTNVSFVGKKNAKELQSYYQNADVFVISSEVEGMPLVILEAMASGLPIVGSNVLGIRELINGIGILVGDSSEENFADALTKLWNDPSQLKHLSTQSMEKAKQYSWDKLITDLETIYEEVLEKKNQ